jgi:hypothetical protein
LRQEKQNIVKPTVLVRRKISVSQQMRISK